MTVRTTEEVKEKVSMSESLFEESRRDFEKANTKHESSIRFLNHISPYLDALPETEDNWSVYSSVTVFFSGPRVTVNYNTPSEEDSNRLRGMVQRVLGMPATREVNSFSSDINWIFEKDYKDPEKPDEKYSRFGNLRVTINHGRLAPGCEIVEEERTIKEFKIVCPEGVTDES